MYKKVIEGRQPWFQKCTKGTKMYLVQPAPGTIMYPGHTGTSGKPPVCWKSHQKSNWGHSWVIHYFTCLSPTCIMRVLQDHLYSLRVVYPYMCTLKDVQLRSFLHFMSCASWLCLTLQIKYHTVHSWTMNLCNSELQHFHLKLHLDNIHMLNERLECHILLETF